MKRKLLAVLFPLLIILTACNSAAPTDQGTTQDQNNKSTTVDNSQEESTSKESPTESEPEQKNNQEESTKENEKSGFNGNNKGESDDKKFGGEGWNGRDIQPNEKKSEDKPAIDSGASEVPLEDALYQYLSVDTVSAYELETEALTAYDSVRGDNYTNDAATQKVLEEEVIPLYTQFIVELIAVEIDNAELQAAHDIYIQGAEKQLEAFIMYAKAYDTTDKVLFDQATDTLDEGVELINEYVSIIQSMRAEVGL